MTDKNKKLSMIILAALCVVLAVALVVVLLVKPGSTAQNTDNVSGPEVGTYYFDAGHQEYTLTLNEGCRFTLYVKGGTESGSYTLNGKALALDFTAEGVQTIEATMEDNVVTLTYNNATMRFLKKVTYNVSFESNGGSALEALSVLNGKSFAQPNDPVREGFVFVGWYVDNEFKAPFAFQADPVTSDITLYARWSEELLGGMEYTVEFDANYEEAENPTAMTTSGGKLFGLPTVDREGYEFKGWWVSEKENREQLSYRYEAGMMLEANTTLYALWQSKDNGSKLPAPVVNVGVASLTWESVPGARSYAVTVIGPDGEALISNEPTSATTFNVPFDSYGPGMYEIRVMALSNTGNENNSEAVRYINNKALGKVSAFEVIDSMLLFNTVENAQKYLISVVCGNPDHQHDLFDNGTSRTFNFANCTMTEEGIRFTVTAVADGFGSSVSKEFVYRRDLNAVEGFRYDETSQMVFWNEVPNAAYYMVSVECGNENHDHAFFNNGSQTAVSVKECDACEGGIVVKVYPKTNGYNSPAVSEMVVNKTVLATPAQIRIVGTKLMWNAVNGAAGYEVQIGEEVHKVTEPMLELADLIEKVEGNAYAISVRATGDTNSAWSDVLNAQYAMLNHKLYYNQNTLFWQGVIGATAYEVQVNDRDIITVSDGSTSLKITLSQAGTNVLQVRYLEGSTASEWVSIEVYAHTVSFDTRGGSMIPDQYVAVGDRLQLPTTTKDGCDFDSWYNVPGGPASNGKAYTDELYAESGSIMLYAHYTPAKYEITYNYGVGGTGEKTTDLVAYENHYQLTVPVANADGRFFGGWFSAPYGMGVQYTDSNGNSLKPWDLMEGTEVFAFWIDAALTFTPTKVAGVDAYIVTAGEQIALLDEITIPATYRGWPVSMIGGNAFKDCTNLRVINLPASLYQISLISPFDGCTSLEAINVYPVEGVNNPRYWSSDGVLFDNGTATVAVPKLQYLPLGKTGTYALPDNITEIPERAFAGSMLTKVIIPASVTKIGNEAFSGSAKLTTVVFESAIGEKGLVIGTRAFKDCTMLSKIVLPKRLESINLTKYIIKNGEIITKDTQHAFVGCTALVSINVMPGSENYKSVDGIVYSGDGKTLIYCPPTLKGSFTIPNGVLAIAPGAFIECDDLTEIFIPNTVTLVGECAFYNLSNSLTKVTFGGNGVYGNVIVEKYAFRGCTQLQEVVLESGSQVSTLNEGAFYDCSSLESFYITPSMTKIGYEAFRGCTSLKTVTFAEKGKTLSFGEAAFMDCTSLTTVNLPANVSEIPGIFIGCTSLQEVNVAEDSEYFTSIDGVVFDKAVAEVLYFPQGKTGTYALPSTVTSIAPGVFAGVTKLDTLQIPNIITNIGDRAFMECNFKIQFVGEEFGEELVIGASAFQGAKNLGDLTLPAHTTVISDNAFSNAKFGTLTLNEGIVSLGNYAFYNANSTKTLAIPASVKTIGEYCFAFDNRGINVSIPASGSQLESIGKYAFCDNSKISTITIPAGVVIIDDYAFHGAKNLKTLTFAEGSNLKTIGAHAFDIYDGKLVTVTIPKSVTSIGAYAFANSDIESVYFEEGGTEDLVLGTVHTYSYLGYGDIMMQSVEHGHVFSKCKYLETVVLPARLTEIGPYCFYNASYYGSGLEVTFEEGSRLATIGDYAFASCGLKSIVIPNTVRNLDPVVMSDLDYSYDRMGIGHYAFADNYSSLSSVVFEQGGTEPLTIGQNAFYNADKLVSIELPARLAPYTSYDGEVYSGLANGSNVFGDAAILESITVEDGGTYYVDRDGVLYTADLKELVLCPAGKTGSVHIPAEVTKIHDMAFYNAQVEQITFEGGTEPMVIGQKAFSRAIKLKNIVLPTNVVSLGSEAFAMYAYDDNALETITLSKNLQNFDGEMIANCFNLKAIYVEEGSNYFVSDDGVLYNAAKTELISYPTSREGESYTLLPTTTVICISAFEGNNNIKEIILPDGLIEIRAFAFSLCTSLETVCIPNTVELIDNNAFGNCTALSNLSFQMGGTCKMVVGKYAFQRIAAQNLVLPATMMYLGDYVFLGSRINSLAFEEGSQLYSMGDQVFQNVPLTTLTLPDGLTTVGSNTFYGCSSLVSVIFGEGLTTLGDGTFENSSVEMVHFPATLQNLGAMTFEGCANLREVTFAPFAQLTVLPEGTFYNTNLERIVIPASIKEFACSETGKGVFQNCAKLQSVTFAEGSQLLKIGRRTFKDCISLASFDIPVTVSSVGEYAFQNCESLTSITVPANVTSMATGIFSTCVNLTDVILETKATELPGWMFANCHNLTSITIPATVSSIGAYCFTNTPIECIDVAAGSKFFVSVDGVLFNADKSQVMLYPEEKKDSSFTIPNTVTTVVEGIFNDNSYLAELIFEDGDQPLQIQKNAFAEMVGLVKVELPERLSRVGQNAFQNCGKLMLINVPSTATSSTFGSGAFSGCTKLMEVRNESALNIKAGDSKYGGIAANAENVYNPETGASIFQEDDNGFITFSQEESGVTYVYIAAYLGEATQVTVPENVTHISEVAFAHTSVTKVVLPEGLLVIDDQAFDHCDLLEEINIPSTVHTIGQQAFNYCESLSMVVIPESVNSMGYYAFDSCGTVQLMVEVTGKQTGWNTYWTDATRIIWGYDGQEHTYKFNTMGAGTVESVTTQYSVDLPKLTRDGYIFGGWYDNANCTGKALKSPYYSTEKTQLYARWLTEDEYFDVFGVDSDHPIEISIGETVTIKITDPGQEVWLHIRVDDSGYRKLYSNASGNDRLDANQYYTSSDGKLVDNGTLVDVDSSGDYWYLDEGDNYVKIYLNGGTTGTFEITLLPYA